MKTLIFDLLVMLCMHTIYASNSDNELESRKTDSAKYLQNFKEEHDKERGYVNEINSISESLIKALKVYSSKDFGKNQSCRDLTMQVKMFDDKFFELYLRALELIARLEKGIDKLVQQTECLDENYKISQVKCKEKCKLSGSEEELFKLKCKLAVLVNAVPGAAKDAGRIIKKLRKGANQLYQQFRGFSNKKHLRCDGDKCGLTVKAVKNLFASMNKTHEDTHKEILILKNLCDNIARVVDSLEN